jgi:hypothetical protein
MKRRASTGGLAYGMPKNAFTLSWTDVPRTRPWRVVALMASVPWLGRAWVRTAKRDKISAVFILEVLEEMNPIQSTMMLYS